RVSPPAVEGPAEEKLLDPDEIALSCRGSCGEFHPSWRPATHREQSTTRFRRIASRPAHVSVAAISWARAVLVGVQAPPLGLSTSRVCVLGIWVGVWHRVRVARAVSPN